VAITSATAARSPVIANMTSCSESSADSGDADFRSGTRARTAGAPGRGNAGPLASSFVTVRSDEPIQH
jgi:hypothetical protein